jgi:hypothetical protein
VARRIFISYQHLDYLKAKGFNLLRWNENVDLEFVGRHLLSPVDSENDDYIARKIREQLKGTSVTVVLIGEETAESSWVEKEINWSAEKGNGLVGIRLAPDVPIPEALEQSGAEILNWFEPGDHKEFQPAIERAAIGMRRAEAILRTGGGVGSCAR